MMLLKICLLLGNQAFCSHWTKRVGSDRNMDALTTFPYITECLRRIIFLHQRAYGLIKRVDTGTGNAEMLQPQSSFTIHRN